MMTTKNMVSVPYRGFIILNKSCGITKICHKKCFRPLSGLYYSKSEGQKNLKKLLTRSFRPLSGLYYSKLKKNCD